MRRTPWLPYLLVAAAAMLPHLPSLGFGFVFDDDFLVAQNAFLRAPWSALRAFGVHFWEGTPFAALYYRPIVNASFALNGKLFGWGPAGFHVVNILLHAANSALVVWLLRRLQAGRAVAMIAGGCFALHPVAAWPVGSIVARVDLLPAFFVLLAWGTFAAGEKAARSGGRRISLWAAAVGGIFLLALLSKESALAFLAVPILAWRASSPIAEPPLERARARFAQLATAACVTAVGIVVLLRIAIGLGLTYERSLLSPITNPLAFQEQPGRFLSAVGLAGRYFLYLFLPIGFSDPRDQRAGAAPPGLASPWVAGTLLFLAAWVALVAYAWIRRDRAARPLAFALAAFLPASNLLVPIGSLYAQNFLYMPLAGMSVALGEVLARRSSRPEGSSPRGHLGRIICWGALPLLALLGIASARESAIWRSNLTLMGAWVERFPYYSLAQGSLGLGLLQGGDSVAAERHFRAALELDPRNIEAQYNLGLLLLTEDRGREGTEEALAHCRAAIEINPGLLAARVNAANALLKLERPVEAESEARAAIAVQPDLVPAHRNLAEALFRQERFPEAAAEFGALAAAFPDDPEIRSPWVVSLIRSGDLERARREAEAARRDFPEEAWFEFCLARIDARSGDPDAALALLTRAARDSELPDWMTKVDDFERYRGRPGWAAILPAMKPPEGESKGK